MGTQLCWHTLLLALLDGYYYQNVCNIEILVLFMVSVFLISFIVNVYPSPNLLSIYLFPCVVCREPYPESSLFLSQSHRTPLCWQTLRRSPPSPPLTTPSQRPGGRHPRSLTQTTGSPQTMSVSLSPTLALILFHFSCCYRNNSKSKGVPPPPPSQAQSTQVSQSATS